MRRISLKVDAGLSLSTMKHKKSSGVYEYKVWRVHIPTFEKSRSRYKHTRKDFSVNTWGEKLAYEKAVEYRKEGVLDFILEAKKQGLFSHTEGKTVYILTEKKSQKKVEN
tara:strand:- start:167 stop:496 length:330 start_codon:yes stop_codon:yes gene_type:complete